MPRQVPPGRPESTTPGTAPGWVAEWEIPPTCARGCWVPCQGGWQCPAGMREPRRVAGQSPSPEAVAVPALWALSPPAVLNLPKLGLGYLTLSSLGGKIRWCGGHAGQEIEASHYPRTSQREASQLGTSPPCPSPEPGHQRLERRLDANSQGAVPGKVPLCQT